MRRSFRIERLVKTLRDCNSFANDHGYIARCRPADIRDALKYIEQLEEEVEDNDAFIDYMTKELAEMPCCHDEGERSATPPSMWPELIRCIVRKAVEVNSQTEGR